MLAGWDAHCVGLRLAIQQSSTQRHVVVARPRTTHAALHELVTRVARLDVHVEVILRHDDEQLAEPQA